MNAHAQPTLYYVYTDQINTPRTVTNTAATPIWKWENLDPYGANAPNQDPDGDTVPFVFNLRFPGQYFDKETNTHYNYYRDYDPAQGRYVESDPIGLEGGINTYGYVRSNPLSYTDPRGDFIPVPVITASIGGLAGGAGYIAGKWFTGGCFKWREFGVAIGFGILQGALAPLGGGLAGAAGIGGATNLLQDALNNALDGQPMNLGDIASSFGIGALGGALGGAWKPGKNYRDARFPDFAREGNRNRDLNANVGFGSSFRNFLGSVGTTAAGEQSKCECR